MQTEYVVVFITAPSPEVAEKVANALVKQKLAACVNIVPAVFSIYPWRGELQNDQEALLIVKTRAALFEEHLIPAVKSVHPYEVPEIIALPVVLGAQDYLEWITAETTADR